MFKDSEEYMAMYDYNQKYREQMPYTRYFFKDAKQLALEYLVNHNLKTVLDYGCAHGTFGKLGEIEYNGAVIEVIGLDDCINNNDAHYHSPSDVKGHFNAIIASHVIEHMEIPEAEQFIEWTKDKADVLIITQPYTYNLFSWYHFFTGIDHKRPYDNANLYYWLDKAGWEIVEVARTDLLYPHWTWVGLLSRIVFATLTQTSSFHMHTVICKRKPTV